MIVKVDNLLFCMHLLNLVSDG